MKDPDSRQKTDSRRSRATGLRGAIASVFGLPQAQHQATIRSAMKDQRQTSIFELPLSDLQTVVFDLETTGFHPYNGDEIISLGAVITVGQMVQAEETFYSLVNPQRKIPDDITRLTRITNEMATVAPDLKEVLPLFLRYVQRRVLVAHGTGHDKQFLNAALWRTAKIHLSHRVLDTILVAKWLHPSWTSYDLDVLLDRYNIPVTTRHHALCDAIMTASLWTKLMAEIADRNITTLGDLYAHLSHHVR